MTTTDFKHRFANILLRISILLIVIGLNFQDSPPPSGWIYQPNTILLSGQEISDASFVDSSTAYAVTAYLGPTTTAYIFKTTNAGFNWSILRTDSTRAGFARVTFLDKNTGFVCGQRGLEKTTNGGVNWLTIPPTDIDYPQEMFILNQDTMWYIVSSSFFGGLHRTTNGGLDWTTQWGGGSNYPKKLHMLNGTTGFLSTDPGGLYKTTDSGFNWTYMYNVGEFFDMYFSDSLTGYLTSYNIQKTTNGGANWIIFQLPDIPGALWTYKGIKKINVFNSDTLMGVYSYAMFSDPYRARSVIYKTTNGGLNWGYQIPDTSYAIGQLSSIGFINNKTGWSYGVLNSQGGLYTTTGGDSTFYTNINSIRNGIAKNFELHQNYPNPYNNSSVIDYYINEPGRVILKIFDITGRELKTLVNEVQGTGGYGIPVSVSLSSGVYFYKLVFIPRSGEAQTDTRKMIVTK